MISQVRSNLQAIINNLKQLQELRHTLSDESLAKETATISTCKQNIETAFDRLDQKSIEKVATEIKQRKRKRNRRTIKVKAKKSAAKTSRSFDEESLLCACASTLTTITRQKKRELQDAQKYLATIESVEELHRLRGGSESCKLSETLKPIKSIWRATAEAISAENSASIADQWNEVLFGGKPEFEEKIGFKQLIERRRIWDSYLVPDDDPDGSSIPVGWVLPREDARPEWKQYLSLN